MKYRFFIIALMLFVFNSAFSQAPMRNYGEYQYVYSLDKDGDRIEATAFPRIKPSVVTTNFFGITQSQAFYMYMVEVCGKIRQLMNGLDFVMGGMSIHFGWVLCIAIFLFLGIMSKSESKRIKMA